MRSALATSSGAGRSSKADAEHGEEGDAPSVRLAGCRPEGHAEHVGERQAGERERAGPGPLVMGSQRARYHSAETEERAMGKGDDDPCEHHQGVVWRQRADGIPNSENRHRREKFYLLPESCVGDGDDRRIHADAGCIAGYEKLSFRKSCAKAVGDLGRSLMFTKAGGSDREGHRREDDKRTGRYASPSSGRTDQAPSPYCVATQPKKFPLMANSS